MTGPIRPKNPRMVRPRFVWMQERTCEGRSTAEKTFLHEHHFFPEEANGLVLLPPPKGGEPQRTPPKRPWPHKVIAGWTLLRDPESDC